MLRERRNGPFVTYYPSIERVMYDVLEEHGSYHTEEEMIELVQNERPEIKPEKIKFILEKWKEAGQVQYWS